MNEFAVRERPILFSAPMVRALLAGSKTQTRRIGKVQCPDWNGLGVEYSNHVTKGVEAVATFDAFPGRGTARHGICACPYGVPGDRLWVREAFRFTSDFDKDSPSRVAERCLDAGYRKPWAPLYFEADGSHVNWMNVGTPTCPTQSPELGKLRPGMFMPRWASRILLEITEVRVERLQEISEADARAEGITQSEIDDCLAVAESMNQRESTPARDCYRTLWENINGEHSWSRNSWVWVIAFRRPNP